MPDDRRIEIKKLVRRRYPRMQPYQQKLIRKALELTFPEASPAAEDQMEREAAAFKEYYARCYRLVRDAVNSIVTDGSAAREVKNGLLVSRWSIERDRLDEGVVSAHLSRLKARVEKALGRQPDVSPYEGFTDDLEAHLWARVFHDGEERMENQLAEIVARETGRIPAWERLIGSEIDSSVQEKFGDCAPEGLVGNLRRALWKYHPTDDWRGALSDSLEIAGMLARKAPLDEVISIVKRRIAGQLKNLVRSQSHIDVNDVLQEAWTRVLQHFNLEPARAPQLPGLLFVIARRVVLDRLRPEGAGNRPPDPPAQRLSLRSLPYAKCPPHQSLAWTWIDVFGKTPRQTASSCASKNLRTVTGDVKARFREKGHSWLDFLQPLEKQLNLQIRGVKMAQATRKIYAHLSGLMCGETFLWHYLTGDLPEEATARLQALENLPIDMRCAQLERHMPKWCHSVNRIWKPAAIDEIYLA
jgi:DNA-directed RNA polymerase specialized sigma24 family protein